MQVIPDILPFLQRYDELDSLMAEPDFFQDSRKAVELSREHQKLHLLISLYRVLEKLESDIGDHESIISDPDSDDELKNLAQEELPVLRNLFENKRNEVLIAMVPPDPADSRNTVLEIRAGAGGDEASLFASDLFRMYSRFAESKGWKVERLGASPSESGGFKQVVCLVTGDDVYKSLKFEMGVHRVQRIPVTEANGRIHTSTATVAVLPEAKEIDVQIDPADLEITVSRSSGPGGQSVNTTDSAVQILHKPTGITVHCADERSQIKNRAKGLKVLRARLLEKEQAEEHAKYAADRRDQIGSGDRSERIRTYNFPQSRVTDHRIGLSLHSLPQLMEGQLEDILMALERADADSKINALIEK
ncbi:MAG: Peptide chain release factor 1 [Candidatus Moanabacter tarae]|uniref:Peptide chain release factor 1 n=1 Tax=Candidatus Moanibacter tarae TaxID=2200854 RepID=A0A2Z4AD60_9BACT|nr:MAG: Peptide chain release factor 1 [Candidatus Moanabacter tarae]|tara:strand:+ start:7200 stop:8282 length:1083 start_codon:yes stop_codon:yes gene_type:complete